MDNFPSFTVLRQVPNWYEGEDAGRAAGAGAAGTRSTKNGRNIGEFGSFRTEAQLLDARAAGGVKQDSQKTRKN